MKKFIISITLFLSIVISGSAFAWEVKTSNDVFDGKIKTWYVKAENDPRYVMNLRWKEKGSYGGPLMEIYLTTPYGYICSHGTAESIVDGEGGRKAFSLDMSSDSTAIFFSSVHGDTFQDSKEMILRVKGGCGTSFTVTFKYGKASQELIDKLNLDNHHADVASLLTNIELDGKREGMRKFTYINYYSAKEVMSKWPQYFKEIK